MSRCASRKSSAPRPLSTTCAPSRARRWAIARPMPRDEPVTSATRPSSPRSTRLPQRLGHVAIARERIGVLAVGGARRLQDEIAGVSRTAKRCENALELRVARAQRNRRAMEHAVLHVHVIDALAVSGDFLGGIEAERRAVTDVVV